MSKSCSRRRKSFSGPLGFICPHFDWKTTWTFSPVNFFFNFAGIFHCLRHSIHCECNFYFHNLRKSRERFPGLSFRTKCAVFQCHLLFILHVFTSSHPPTRILRLFSFLQLCFFPFSLLVSYFVVNLCIRTHTNFPVYFDVEFHMQAQQDRAKHLASSRIHFSLSISLAPLHSLTFGIFRWRLEFGLPNVCSPTFEELVLCVCVCVCLSLSLSLFLCVCVYESAGERVWSFLYVKAEVYIHQTSPTIFKFCVHCNDVNTNRFQKLYMINFSIYSFWLDRLPNLVLT